MFKLNLFSSVRRRNAILFCALFASLAGLCPAQTNISEFPILSSFNSVPTGIAYGPDTNYWFTEFAGGKIGQIATTGSNLITETTLTNNGSAQPFNIVVGPDTNLWFTESSANQIGRITTAGNYLEFSLPNATNRPATITVGPDGCLWFVEFNLNRIAAISPYNTNANGAPYTTNGPLTLVHEFGPFGTNTQYGSPGNFAEMNGLTTGPDGNIWFTQGTYGVIGTINTNGTVTNLFQLPVTNCNPAYIVTGPDGALWFTEFIGNKIGRITTNGQVTEFTLPLNPNYPNPEPYNIIAGRDGNLWFTEYNGSAIGRITTSGIITIFPTPTAGSFPAFLATGSTNQGADPNIWFTEAFNGAQNSRYQNIGRLMVSQALNLSAPANTSFTTGTTVTNLIATFQNSTPTNTVTVNWGDGTGDTLLITNPAANAFVTTNTILVTNSVTVTNSLTITNTAQISTNGNNGTYQVYASHTYSVLSNYLITLTVTDPSNDMATASIALPPTPFFTGEVSLSNQVEYLQFPNTTNFGYYTLAYFPYVYHFDLGFEYFFDANDGQGDAYLYDFTTGHFFYTGPGLFPYLYDFSLNSWLYYYPDTNRAGHYTTNPRYFYNFGANKTITQ